MHVFRIVKSKNRTSDLSGIGAFQSGGRWNNKGSYVLYTSENSSLAFLENLVHFDAEETPDDLYIIDIKIQDERLIYLVPDSDYPERWFDMDNFASKNFGDNLLRKHEFLGIKVRSAVNQSEYNILLDPLFPGYHTNVEILSVTKIPIDQRLL